MNTNDEPTKNLRKIFEKSSKNGWKMRKIRLAGNAKCDAYSFVVSRSEQPRSKIRVSGARSEGEPGRAGESPGRDRATWRLVAPAEGSSSRRWGTKKCERGPGAGYTRGMAGAWEGEKREETEAAHRGVASRVFQSGSSGFWLAPRPTGGLTSENRTQASLLSPLFARAVSHGQS